MEILWLFSCSLFLMWVVFVSNSALVYYSNGGWWWRLWIEANERYGCCQEEMGSSGVLNPKVTVFMSFFWTWSRWVSKETNELRLFLLVEHFGFEGLQCLSLSELWFWSLAWTCLKLNLLGLLISYNWSRHLLSGGSIVYRLYHIVWEDSNR